MADEKMNTGYSNAGHYNAGSYNAGYSNAGYSNAGNSNAGNYNAGNYNAGSYNAGNYNAGNSNAGYSNAGNSNAGNYNAGSYNAGYSNAGHSNAGSYNAGSGKAGFFCTEDRSPVFFDKPTNLSWGKARAMVPIVDLNVGVAWVYASEMTDAEKAKTPSHKTTGGFLRAYDKPIREVFPVAWAKMDDETKQRFKSLPNFDAEKFLAITGVDVRPKPLKRARLAGGEIVMVEVLD